MAKQWMGSLAIAILASAAATGCVDPSTTDGDEEAEGAEASSEGDLGEAEQAYTASPGGPSCALSASPASGLPPLTTSLTAACSDPNGDAVTAHYITCGNGAYYFGPGNTFGCAYSSIGTYSACVQAMDATGAWGAQSCVAISAAGSAHAELEAWVTYDPTSPKCAKVTGFGGNSYSVGGTITSYQWDIDGASYSGMKASRTLCYRYGFVPVSLTVTDSNSKTDTQSGGVSVCPKLYEDKGFCSTVLY